jgi:hypothetical protein
VTETGSGRRIITLKMEAAFPAKLRTKEIIQHGVKQRQIFSVYISFAGSPKHGAYNYKRSGESPPFKVRIKIVIRPTAITLCPLIWNCNFEACLVVASV